MNYPVDCDTPRKRYQFLMRGQELARRLHNRMGRWFDSGLTASQWDKLPNKIKTRYPYKINLSEGEWRDFLNVPFDKISNNIDVQVGIQRGLLFSSEQWTPDLDALAEL